MADVSADIKDWSITASSNSPADATTVGAGLADNLQQIQATVRAAFAHKGADIASATTTDLGAVTGFYHDISGTTTITGFGTVSAGVRKVLQFDGALTLTYNATSMILPGNVDITTAAGDHLEAMSLGSGNWVVLWYSKDAAGAAPPFSDAVGIVRGSADATKIVRLEVDGLTTATTRVLTVQDEDGTVALTSEFAYANVAGSSGRQVFSRMWISGLVQSVSGADASHDTSISAGECMDASNAQNMILASALIKQIDASWAVGTNQGGLDTGSVGNSTWYYIWLIKRSDTGVVDALYSTSASSPTMPDDYDYKRLIGAVLTDGSANILAYTAIEDSGGGLDVLWSDPPLDVSVTNQDQTAVLRTLSTPLGIKTNALINAWANDSTVNTSVYISSPDANNEAAALSTAPSAQLVICVTNGSALAQLSVRTNTSSQIRTVSSSGAADTSVAIVTLGYVWSRR